MNNVVTSPRQQIISYLKSIISQNMTVEEFVNILESPEVKPYISNIYPEDLGIKLKSDWKEIVQSKEKYDY